MHQDRLNEILFSDGGDIVCDDVDLITYAVRYLEYLSRRIREYEQMGSEITARHNNSKMIGRPIIADGAFDVIKAAEAMKNLANAFAVTSFTAQQAADGMVGFGRQLGKTNSRVLDYMNVLATN